MGKFQGMLLLSDYDNTLHYTEDALRAGTEVPPISPRNLEALSYWTNQGGLFSVATGRALAAFRRQAASLPINAPVVVDNGGAIYDLAAGRYLVKNYLPKGALERIAAVMEAFPGVSLELYHEDDLVQVMRPTAWNDQHALLTGLGYEVVDRLERETVPMPLAKALFVSEPAQLRGLRDRMIRMGWAADYELIFSSGHLLEMTARGANKGDMALRLKALCGCRRLFCAGDHANDLPMLRAADRGFAPANAIPEVLCSGAERVCHCMDGALADIVELLDREGCSAAK